MATEQQKTYHGPYPWAEWFGRRKFVLRRGTDYACLTHGMVAQVRNRASRDRRGVSISVLDDGGVETIVVTVRRLP